MNTVEIQAGGLQRGDLLSTDGGKTFRKVARVSHHKGRVTVHFDTAHLSRSLTFNDDEIVITNADA